MPFYCEPIVEKEFTNFAEVKNWTMDEGQRLKRIPFFQMLKQGARFLDDEYFGDEDRFFKFNQHGIRALLQPLGLRFDTLNLVERPGLISDMLNDLIFQQEIMDRLHHSDFVVDKGSDTILGAVSDSYITYSNSDFLKTIHGLLGDTQQAIFPSDTIGRFRFVSGFSVNTQTFLRFALTVKSGRVSGWGGEGEDVSEIGIQFKNSMVGDAAVTIQYFVNRLVCANGLIVPAGKSHSRVFHSGKPENFKARLNKCFREVEGKIGTAGESIKTLMSIDFDPEALVRAKMTDQVFDIIPGSRSRVMEEHGIKKRQKKKMTEAERIRHEARIIHNIADTYAGEFSARVFDSAYRDNATMFDFINIFTEYAQTQPIGNRLEIEERAGILADQIAKNRKKFAAAQS